jgi:hypothetical protein
LEKQAAPPSADSPPAAAPIKKQGENKRARHFQKLEDRVIKPVESVPKADEVSQSFSEYGRESDQNGPTNGTVKEMTQETPVEKSGQDDGKEKIPVQEADFINQRQKKKKKKRRKRNKVGPSAMEQGTTKPSLSASYVNNEADKNSGKVDWVKDNYIFDENEDFGKSVAQPEMKEHGLSEDQNAARPLSELITANAGTFKRKRRSRGTKKHSTPTETELPISGVIEAAKDRHS